LLAVLHFAFVFQAPGVLLTPFKHEFLSSTYEELLELNDDVPLQLSSLLHYVVEIPLLKLILEPISIILLFHELIFLALLVF
jgi:hypothetical protein